jgi:two-component system OmpR family sensor kinase
LAVDASLVVLATVVCALLERWIALSSTLPATTVLPLLGMTTAGAGAIVALLSLVITRLRHDDPRPGAVATAWAFYAVGVMPLSVVQTVGHSSVVLGAAGFTASVLFLGLLAVGLVGVRGRGLVGVPGLGIAAALTAIVMAFAMLLPSSVAALLSSPVPNFAVAAAWLLLGCGFTVSGLLDRDRCWWRMGLGLGVVAAAELVRLLLGGSAVQFSVLRLLGLVVLIAALGRYARRAYRQLRADQVHDAERTAALSHAYAQRDHEMRNALANLAAVPSLIGRFRESPVDGEGAALMIRAELRRLGDLLDGKPTDADGSVAVEPVLSRLAMLRRALGMAVTVDCPDDLVAALPSPILAQVLTNLLANCERHAPGSAVRIEARRAGRMCSIAVIDDGPGPRTGATSQGSGVGLTLTDRLLAAHGGRFELHARQPQGCTARIEVPMRAAEHVPGATRWAHERVAS